MAEGVLFDIAKDLLECLGKSAFKEVSSWCGVRGDLRKLEQSLTLIKARVTDAEKRREEENSTTIKEWLRRLRGVLFKADDLFDDVFTAQRRKQRLQQNMGMKVRLLFSTSSPLLFNIRVAREIKSIRQELDGIKSDMDGLNLRVCDPRENSQVPMAHLMSKRETTSFVQPDDVIGRDNDKNEIIKRLVDPEYAQDGVSVIPIVGFGGTGKTTLAQLVFNDETVKKHFELTKWACVPEVDNLNQVMCNICNTLIDDNCRDFSLEQIQSRIQESLRNKKYLLVLDDIWDEDRDRWLQLWSLLKCGSEGSKVIVTTRSHVVAKVVGTLPTYKLGLLTDEDSWKLFRKLAFKEGQEESNPNFTRIGKDIVDRCANVPLAIRVVGSLLYSKDTEQEWVMFRDVSLSKMNIIEEDTIMPVLKLSYDFLPAPLKLCFAYCSIFPKDYKFEKNELVQLWMAQGYIESSNESISLEDVGDLYFLELLRRNFFQEAEGYDITNDIHRCKMHDLLHDLALRVTGDDDVMEEKRCLLGEDNATQSLSSLVVTRKMRSVLSISYNLDLNWTSMIQSFQSLRALKLISTKNETLPECIGRLRHLRYLSLRSSDIEYLPNAITKLENLQTLELIYCSQLKELPRGLTKLVNLRHLQIARCYKLTDMPSGLGEMKSLQELEYFIVGKSNGVDALTNLDLRGSLEINFRKWHRNSVPEARRLNMEGKERLVRLTLSLGFAEEEVTPATNDDMELLLDCIMFPPNLKVLEVRDYTGERFPSRMIDQLPCLLPNLVDVTIVNCKRCRQLPHFHQLHHLESLHLEGLEAVEYIEDDRWDGDGVVEPHFTTYFPALGRLWLEDMPNLKGWWSKQREKDKVQVAQQDMTTTILQSHEHLASQQLPSLYFPRLSEVHIRGCKQLASMPSFLPKLEFLDVSGIQAKLLESLVAPNREEGPSSPTSSLTTPSTLKTLFVLPIDDLVSFSLKFSNLDSLHIWFCDKLINLSGVSPNSSIRYLELRGLENMTTLSEEIGHLSQLRKLKIDECPKLVSLPQSFGSLSSLQHLEIRRCPLLKARCQRETGEDWPLIQHIPYIELDWEQI